MRVLVSNRFRHLSCLQLIGKARLCVALSNQGFAKLAYLVGLQIRLAAEHQVLPEAPTALQERVDTSAMSCTCAHILYVPIHNRHAKHCRTSSKT